MALFRSRRGFVVAAALVAAFVLASVVRLPASAQLPPLNPTPTPTPAPAPEPAPPPPQPAPQPEPQPAVPGGSGEGRRVVYSNSQQRVWLVEQNGTVFGTWPVSGRKNVPKPGTHSVFSRSRNSSASGGLRLEYMVRFIRGKPLAIGFHAIPTNRKGQQIQRDDEVGQFRSRGCVRQRKADAARMWDWAQLGTKVVVTR
ncbi:MAG TPA: L,D-transpeptidase [Actinomycetota bacterium]|nr:L,D-transpeptidase [Actinomycetota bacterium]